MKTPAVLKRVPERRTQEERTALSDERMFAAAVSLLVERGTAGTTLAAIGERAGYSRGLVTHRFGSKAGLFAHLHDRAVASWIARVQQAVGTRTGVDALERVVDALHGFVAEQPDEIRAMYLLRYASIDPSAEFRTSVARAHKAQRRDVQRWIEAGQKAGSVDPRIDAELAAELFCASADGLVYRWLVNPRLAIGRLHALLKQQLARAFDAASR
ncbi:MAG: TetR/AcrR family transcriptional regulator [Gammaproteobacteria bacterium]